MAELTEEPDTSTNVSISQVNFIVTYTNTLISHFFSVIHSIPLSGFFEPPAPPKVFNADHPFIFYLKKKDVIIFFGKYSIINT